MRAHKSFRQETEERPHGSPGANLDRDGLVLTPNKLAEGVYALMANTPLKDNNGVIVGERGSLVVDAGFNGAMAHLIQKTVHKLTRQPILYLVNTTYHGDHSFGNYAFPQDVTILSSRANRENIREREKRIRARNLRGNVNSIADVMTWRCPDIVFESYLEVDLGQQLVELWHFGPRNAPCDTIVYVPSAKVAWTGNLLPASGFPPMLLESGPDPYLTTLHAMESTLDVTTIVPGHGPLGPAAPVLANLIAYLQELRDDVRDSIASGLSLEATLAAHPTSGRLRPTDDAAWTPEMNALRRDLHGLNVLVTYRALESEGATKGMERIKKLG